MCSIPCPCQYLPCLEPYGQTIRKTKLAVFLNFFSLGLKCLCIFMTQTHEFPLQQRLSTRDLHLPMATLSSWFQLLQLYKMHYWSEPHNSAPFSFLQHEVPRSTSGTSPPTMGYYGSVFVRLFLQYASSSLCSWRWDGWGDERGSVRVRCFVFRRVQHID